MKQPTTIYCVPVDGFLVRLKSDGKLMIGSKGQKFVERPWYFDILTQQPWIPRRSHFIKIMRFQLRDVFRKL